MADNIHHPVSRYLGALGPGALGRLDRLCNLRFFEVLVANGPRRSLGVPGVVRCLGVKTYTR